MPWAVLHDPAIVGEAVQVLLAQGLPIREVARRLQVSKTTVARLSAPQAGRRKVLQKPRYCSGCGFRIRVVPCVSCQALAAPRPIAKPDKQRIDVGRVEKIEPLSIDLAGEELQRYQDMRRAGIRSQESEYD